MVAVLLLLLLAVLDLFRHRPLRQSSFSFVSDPKRAMDRLEWLAAVRLSEQVCVLFIEIRSRVEIRSGVAEFILRQQQRQSHSFTV